MELIWHSRRMQRFGACFFLTVTLIFVWRRVSWPAVLYISPNIGNSHSVTAVAPEQQLHGQTPGYDVKHMPKIPTVPIAPAKLPLRDVAVAAPAYVTPTHDKTRVALIIETRPAPVLPALLAHMISVLPPQWVVKVVGTNESFAPILSSRSLKYHLKSTKLQLVNLLDYYSMTSQETVSQTLTNVTFYRNFMAPAKWILMFQSDSIICAASKQTVDGLVDKNYSWAGAPWFKDVIGGNGGLSLRNVSAIVNLLERHERPKRCRQFEDVYVSDRLDNSAARGKDELSFSVELMYHESPLSYHLRGLGKLLDPAIWANETRVRQILEYCPEVRIVLPMTKDDVGDTGGRFSIKLPTALFPLFPLHAFRSIPTKQQHVFSTGASMKYSAVFLAFVTAVAARSASELAAAIPACAKPSLDEAATNADCGVAHYACHCGPKKEQVIRDAYSKFVSACPIGTDDDVLEAINDLCESFSTAANTNYDAAISTTSVSGVAQNAAGMNAVYMGGMLSVAGGFAAI